MTIVLLAVDLRRMQKVECRRTTKALRQKATASRRAHLCVASAKLLDDGCIYLYFDGLHIDSLGLGCEFIPTQPGGVLCAFTSNLRKRSIGRNPACDNLGELFVSGVS